MLKNPKRLYLKYNTIKLGLYHFIGKWQKHDNNRGDFNHSKLIFMYFNSIKILSVTITKGDIKQGNINLV